MVLGLMTCTPLDMPKVPSVKTRMIQNITNESAEISVEIIDKGEGNVIFGVCYATTPNPTISQSKTEVNQINNDNYNAIISKLNPNTNYYVRAYAQVGQNTIYGEDQNFRTEFAANITAEWFLANAQVRIDWWNSLEDPWKKAFNWHFGTGEILTILSDKELKQLFDATELAFYGTNSTSEPKRLSFNLTNLSGIRYFTNLYSLECKDNEINSLDLIKNLTNLRYIDFRGNKITTLEPLKSLSNIGYIFCANNSINTLEPLRNLTSLIHVDCSNTPVSSLEPLKNATNLNYLVCNNIQLNNIEILTNLTNLLSLDVQNNKISSLKGVEKMNQLQFLRAKNGNTIPQTEIERIEKLLRITVQ